MIKYPKVSDELLSVKVKKILFKMMKDGEFDKTGRLPSEAEIADKLSVSRTVIRDVYRLLETEGYIIRRRGIGTLINYNVLYIKERLDVDHVDEFYNLVRESNNTPETRFLEYCELAATPELAERFNIEPGDLLICLKRVITADGIPVIYCENYFPKVFLCKKISSENDFKRPIFEFMEHYCNMRIHHEIANIKPILLSKK